jgi:Tol biopolymer transport system component
VRLDVAVVDASTDAQVGQITSDGRSWAPVWSPRGDQLAYMHQTGSTVDLYVAGVSHSGSTLTFDPAERLIGYSGLDGGSPVAWFVPGLDATPSPAPSPSG